MPTRPVGGRAGSGYGASRPTKKEPNRRHGGIDYEVAEGTPVKAALRGKVVSSFHHKPKTEDVLGKNGKMRKKFVHGSYGEMIVLDHTLDDKGNIYDPTRTTFDEDGNLVEPRKVTPYTYTLYSHLSDRSAKQIGVVIPEGKVIGHSGRTGTIQDYKNWKGGYHLHFEVQQSTSELKWMPRGPNTGIAPWEHTVDPATFLSQDFPLDDMSAGRRPMTAQEIDKYPPPAPPKPKVPVTRVKPAFPFSIRAVRGDSGSGRRSGRG